MTIQNQRVAREIERRFLPDHRALLQKVIERNEASDKYHNGQIRAMRMIADYLGVERPEDGRRLYISSNIDGIHSIEAYGLDTVKFPVVTTCEKPIKILEILKNKID